MTSAKERWIGVLIGLAGTGLCLTALVMFFTTIVDNNLPWHPDQTVREHYVAVGRAFSQGFSVGFFLCFFITVVALVFGAWLRERRESDDEEAYDADYDERDEIRRAPALARKTGG